MLDVGCSQGICELLLARQGYRVVGIDVAQESIRYAREMIDKEPFAVKECVQFYCADFITEVDLHEKFDTILLTEVLEHLVEPIKMLEKAVGLLADGGHMVVTVPFGINDFPDHKHTFYMADMIDMLSRFLTVDHIEFMGGWIGFCCSKVENPVKTEKLDISLIQREEQAFFALERPIRDRLTDVTERQKKAASNYETAKGWVKDRDEKIAMLTKQAEKLQQEISVQEKQLAAVREEKIAEVQRYQQEISAQEKQLTVLRGELSALENKVAELRTEMTAEKQYHQQKISTLEAESKKQISSLQQELASVKKAAEQEKKNNQTQALALRKECNMLAQKYKLLSEAKLGRFTLWYWKRKDAVLYQFRRGDPNAKTIRNFSKKIPGLRPLVLLIRKLFHREQYAQVTIPVQNEPVAIKTVSAALQESKRVVYPTITVVIPTYKKNDYLEACVDSVLKQDYPAEKIEIILSVNGKDAEYAQWLTRQYAGEKRIRVIYTEIPGLSSGRNYSKGFIRGEYVTYLDDDDYFTPGYLREMAKYASGDVSIVCGRMIDLQNDGSIEENTYINKAMEKAGEGLHQEYLPIGSLLSSACAKLYKTSTVVDVWGDFDESLKHTEDVVFWVENMHKPLGCIAVCGHNTQQAYVRRKLDNSMSRPSKDKEFVFYITDRIGLLERYAEELLKPERPLQYKRFVLTKIDATVQMMLRYFQTCTQEEKERARSLIVASDCLFLNKSLFAEKKALAFCHNFSPAVDASAFVASKRLRQISEYIGEPLAWKVIHADMSKVRTSDPYWEMFFARYQYAQSVTTPGPVYFSEAAQVAWGEKAFELVKDEVVPYIYSRSMWAGSHVAARLYKQAHPETIWIAEFSDPLYMDVSGKVRPASTQFTGEQAYLNTFWKDLESAVTCGADKIIYTNDNQRKYMLAHNPVDDCVDMDEKALVWHHPQIDKRYADIIPTTHVFNQEHINIGYFGTFYANRSADPILMFLDNPKVHIHIFTGVTKELQEKMSGISERVHLYPLVPHLEVFAIAKRLDYLFLNDVSFPGEITPYLPSKLADYLSVDTPILGLVYPNTPMDDMKAEKLIKFSEVDCSVVNDLKKNS